MAVFVNKSDNLPVLTLDAQSRISRQDDALKDKLSTALWHLWSQYQINSVPRAEGNVRVHELAVSYAIELFQIQHVEYAQFDLEPERFAHCMRMLANRVAGQACPPRVVQCPFHLESLQDDKVYLELLAHALRSQVEAAIRAKAERPPASASLSAKQLISNPLSEKNKTAGQLASEAHVDPSVISAIRRGDNKCGEEALQRIASLLGCDVNALRSKG